MSSPAAVDLAALREDLIGVAEQIHGVKRTARLITERIGEVRVNATRARENLETYAAAAFAKGEHSVEAIEADRARLLDEINAAEVQKVTNLEREAFNADKVLEQILVISDKGRGEYYAAGGVEPEMGWDAVGEASWTRTNSGVKHPPRA